MRVSYSLGRRRCRRLPLGQLGNWPRFFNSREDLSLRGIRSAPSMLRNWANWCCRLRNCCRRHDCDEEKVTRSGNDLHFVIWYSIFLAVPDKTLAVSQTDLLRRFCFQNQVFSSENHSTTPVPSRVWRGRNAKSFLIRIRWPFKLRCQCPCFSVLWYEFNSTASFSLVKERDIKILT